MITANCISSTGYTENTDCQPIHCLPILLVLTSAPLVVILKTICKLVISTIKANEILLKKGVIEQKERPSKSNPSGVRSFKSLKKEYTHLGENQVSPHNPRETQILWYAGKKDEILELIGCNVMSIEILSSPPAMKVYCPLYLLTAPLWLSHPVYLPSIASQLIL
jgi:hypothetical protein